MPFNGQTLECVCMCVCVKGTQKEWVPGGSFKLVAKSLISSDTYFLIGGVPTWPYK